MSDFYSEAKTRTARKDHRCTYYGETIPKDDPLYQEGFQAGAASRDAEVNDWRSQAHRSQSEADNAIAECDQLRAELAAALAACKAKDEALNTIVTVFYPKGIWKQAREALAIQPDDSALKAWLGAPVAWEFTDAFGTHYTDDRRDWMDTPGIESVTPLYSPKGLK